MTWREWLARLFSKKCRHEFTYWERRKEWPTQWWRIYTKCEATQLRYSDTEPENK